MSAANITFFPIDLCTRLAYNDREKESGGETAMRKCTMLLAISLVLLAGCSCSRDLVPDSVLAGLHKPVIHSITPTTIRVSGAGFYLSVILPSAAAADAQYVLYINERKVGQVNRGDSQYGGPGNFDSLQVGWMVPKELLNQLLAQPPSSGTFSVRVTGINENYDISGDFEKYRDYVSEPVAIEIRKGETQFSEAKQLFPEWTHSREPVIRCDPRGNIYLAWLEKLNGVYQAFFSFSADGGKTWSQVLNISRSGDWVEEIDLAADGAGHFYMTWKVGNQESNVYLCRSLDYGASWNLPERMNANGEYALEPALAVSERGDVYLVWKQASGVRLAVSTDLGNSWKTKDFAASAADYFWRPLLAARPGGHVVLFNGRFQMSDHLVFDLQSSLDYGNTWQKQEFAVGDAWPDATHPLLRFGPGNQANISWGGATDIGRMYSHWNHFLRRESSGAWAAIQDLDDFCSAEVGAGVALAVSAASVDVMMAGRGCLFLLRSSDDGGSWPVPETVSGSDGYHVSGFQDMVVHPAGKTFLVFVRKSSQADGDLYLTQFE
jgi:hypothetical protein